MTETPQQQRLFGIDAAPEPIAPESDAAAAEIDLAPDSVAEAAAVEQEQIAAQQRQIVEQWLDAPPAGPAAVAAMRRQLLEQGVFDRIGSRVLSAADTVRVVAKTSGKPDEAVERLMQELTAETLEGMSRFVRAAVVDPETAVEYQQYLAREVLIESHLAAIEGYAAALDAAGLPATGEIDLGQPDEPGSYWDFYDQTGGYFQDIAVDLVFVDAQADLAEQIIGVLSSDSIRQTLDDLGKRLGQRKRSSRPRRRQPPPDLQSILSSSAQPFTEARRALTHPKRLAVGSGSPFPMMEVKRHRLSMTVQIVPGRIDDMLGYSSAPPDERAVIERIASRMQGEITPLAAHALTAISHLWLQRASGPDSAVVIKLDELIGLRGKKARLSGSGRRGGYTPAQRRDMLQAVMQAESLGLRIELDPKEAARAPQPFVETRVFVITDMAGQKLLDGADDYQAIRVMPGQYFARYLWRSDPQLARISVATLGLDPYRHAVETRLSYELHTLWRVRASTKTYANPIRISTLLGYADQPASAAGYDRLEQALEKLLERGIIAAWQYDDGYDGKSSPETRVTIEPPEWLREEYAGIERPQKRAARGSRKPQAIGAGSIDELGPRLQAARKRLGLSQLVVAEDVGISQKSYSEAERGKRAGTDVRRKLERWLAGVEGGAA